MDAPGLLIAKNASNTGVFLYDLDGAGCGWNIIWRRDWDSNPGTSFPANGFQDRRLRPLGHPSKLDLTRLDNFLTAHVPT